MSLFGFKNKEIELLKAKHEAEINELKLNHSKELSLLAKEKALLEGENKYIKMKLDSLEDTYEYFASWTNTCECQIVSDMFARSRIPLPPLESKEIYTFAGIPFKEKVL